MKLFQNFILIGILTWQVECCGSGGGNVNSVIIGEGNVKQVSINGSDNTIIGFQLDKARNGRNDFLDLFRLLEDALLTCVEAKGVCVPNEYCVAFGGEARKDWCTYEHNVCCLNVVTPENMELVSPIIKNEKRTLQHGDYIELRSKCKKSQGLVSHYCKKGDGNCKDAHVLVNYDFFEWKIIGENLNIRNNITSGTSITISADDHHLNCVTKHCHAKKQVKKCNFGDSKAWKDRRCKKSTYMIYAPKRQGKCSIDEAGCKGDVIRQGDEVYIKSLYKKGDYRLMNDPSRGNLSDVVLTNAKSRKFSEECSTWTVQILSASIVNMYNTKG